MRCNALSAQLAVPSRPVLLRPAFGMFLCCSLKSVFAVTHFIAAVELSLTNFDTKHLEEVVNQGFNISSNQIQYSIVDQRPKKLMKQFCEKHAIKILSYGTLCEFNFCLNIIVFNILQIF